MAKIGLGNLVVATARGIGLDDLSITEDNDGKQQNNDGGDPRCEYQRRDPTDSAEGQNQQKFLRAVGNR